MRARAFRRVLPITLLAVLVLLAGVSLWRGIARVPAGSFGVAGGRVLQPGLRLLLPWQTMSLYPAADVDLRGSSPALGAEGALREASWALRVAADPRQASRLPESAGGSPEEGLAAAVEEALRHALRDPPSAALPAEERVRRALGAQGLVVRSVQVDFAPARPEPATPEEPGGSAAPASGQRSGPRAAPIALIGLDGADWQIIDPLLAAGRMPHMARLRARARWGHLRSFEPILSPLLWTTAVTGKPPDEHGIIDFLVTDPATGARAPISSRSRKVKALWNIFTDHGLSVDVVAWWASWPAEPVRGHIVTDRMAYSLFQVATETQGLTWPAELERTLRPEMTQDTGIDHAAIRRFVDVPPEEFAAARARAASDPERAYKEPVNHLARILASTRSYHQAAVTLLEGGQPDLLAVYYQGIDEVSHRFAHFMPPRMSGVTAADFGRYRRAVEEFYVFQDELMGDLLERLDPSTRVVVLSDHGFHNGSSRPTDGPADIEGKPGKWHRLYGIILAAGGGITPGRFDTATLYDIAPTVLALAGLPLADDMKGEPLLLAGAPAARIATYERSAPPAGMTASAAGASEAGAASGAGAPAASLPVAPGGAALTAGAADEELLRNLASLGYIGSASAAPRVPAAPAPGRAALGAPGPASVTAHANLAAVLLQKGDVRGAESELRQALALAPGYFPALMSLGQVLVRQGQVEEALQVTRHAVARADDADPGAYVQLAMLASRTGQAPQAANFLAGLRGRRPRSAGPDTALGVLAGLQGDAAASERFLRAALSIEPASPEPMGRLFALYRERGREAALVPELRRALSISDRSVLHLNWMGLARSSAGDVGQAEASFRRALKLAPDFGGTMANLGSLYGRSGRLEEAVEILSRALRIEPRHVEARVNLGAALAKLGRHDEAIDRLAEARALGLRTPELLNALGLAYAESGRAREAMETLRESLSVRPDQPQVQALLSELSRES
jgi:predicted AlkP superfamily phosphohydrolase/phosphomutase/tetratricopeptide (TPR) repeat protein